MIERNWGIAIPGFTMAAAEIPEVPGLHVLENPDVGNGPDWGRPYNLEELAEFHATIVRDRCARQQVGNPILIGMSMGGMILAIMATKFASLLPPVASLRFLVTTPNDPDLPAIPEATMQNWLQAKPGDKESFVKILAPFFSLSFRSEHSVKCEEFYTGRANGENGQSAIAYFAQAKALRDCHAGDYFRELGKSERWHDGNCVFVGGEADEVLGPPHSQRLERYVPQARHIAVPNLGHMINMERPEFFQYALPG